MSGRRFGSEPEAAAQVRCGRCRKPVPKRAVLSRSGVGSAAAWRLSFPFNSRRFHLPQIIGIMKIARMLCAALALAITAAACDSYPTGPVAEDELAPIIGSGTGT